MQDSTNIIFERIKNEISQELSTRINNLVHQKLPVGITDAEFDNFETRHIVIIKTNKPQVNQEHNEKLQLESNEQIVITCNPAQDLKFKLLKKTLKNIENRPDFLGWWF